MNIKIILSNFLKGSGSEITVRGQLRSQTENKESFDQILSDKKVKIRQNSHIWVILKVNTFRLKALYKLRVPISCVSDSDLSRIFELKCLLLTFNSFKLKTYLNKRKFN